MSATWYNVYRDGEGIRHLSPESANDYSHCWDRSRVLDGLEPTWRRVEERWNGHWLRPPVGMRAQQASHAWALPGGNSYGMTVHNCCTFYLKLEPRA